MTAARLDLPARPRILVIALRRLGDVLLTTPLIRSLRRAWPDARVEALVFADTAGILDGNPDLDRRRHHAAAPERGTKPGARGAAVAALRPRGLDANRRPPDLLCLGRRRIRVGLDAGGRPAEKRLAVIAALPSSRGVHRVEEILRLADALGIARVPELVCPRRARSTDSAPASLTR